MQKIRIDFDNPGLPQHISAVENDSQSRFSAAFKAYYGMLPKEYRRKCASQEIFPDASTLDT